MAEFSEEFEKAKDAAKSLKKDIKDFVKDLKEGVGAVGRMTTAMRGGVGGGGGGGKEDNRTSPPNYQGMGSSGSNPYASMGSEAAHKYTGMGPVDKPNVRSEKTIEYVKSFGRMLSQYGAAAAMSIPEPNEALYTALLGERLRFYGARDIEGKKIPGLFGPRGAFELQQQFSEVGTPTSALDAVFSANMSAGVGLLPGLKNYSSGLKQFGGVLGGAALASNLNPGLGLAGGIQMMGAMNQARRVNMLRMIGVSVRNIGGTQMKDLPEIIEQLYNILKHANGGANPTAEDIAISAQSGNALDSLLNQFFDDPNMRQVIISGLMQMVNTKGQNLRKSGRPGAMQKTGGSIAAVRSLAKTDTAELRFIQAFTEPVLSGVQIGNKVLRTYYDAMQDAVTASGGPLGFGSYLGAGTSGIASLMGMAETIGGSRNGAGQLFLSATAGGIMDILGKLGPLGKALAFLSLAIGAPTAYKMRGQALEEIPVINRFTGSTMEGIGGDYDAWNDNWLKNILGSPLTNQKPNFSAFASTPMAAPSAYSSTQSGSIVINAYANSSTDPLVMGAALASAIQNQSAMSGAMF